ncbi:MAG: TetR/AcrR family transcriptional regulator [Pleomorphochaeta sp.]
MEQVKKRAKDRRPAKTKKAIRLALFQLLDKKELNKITITELTKQANISRKTFYIHYDKISNVLDEFEQELIEAFHNATKDLKYCNNSKFFFDIFYNLDKYFNDDLDYYKKIAQSSFSNTFSDHIGDALFSKLYEVLEPICDLPIEQIEYLCLIISSSMHRVFMSWIRNDSEMSIVQISNFVAKVVFNGMGTYLSNE